MRLNNFFKLVIALAVCESAGIIGSVFTAPAISEWYANLAKPAFTPPAWVFAPVWTALFALMGVAAFLVWRKSLERRDVKIALGIFLGQLVLNVFWSFLFFGLKSPAAAFVEIVFLWLAILAATVAFAKISKPAAWLLAPYLVWVAFAGFLNYSIWQLNPNPVSAGEPEEIFCTMEAKLCPDGSSVGRTGPNCEFEPCPQENNEPEWGTVADSKMGVIFQAPKQLTTKYIRAFEWPPQVQISNEPFACLEKALETAPFEQTEKRMVDNRQYCVTKTVEGAAGSLYTQYAYAFPKDNKTITLVFTLQAHQCGNYDEFQKSACEAERETFDLDGVIDRVAQTLKLVPAQH